MRALFETVVLALFVGSFAVGYAVQIPGHAQWGLAMFGAALFLSIGAVMWPSRRPRTS